MLLKSETEQARTSTREQTDLKREYRPIGIGAVAAALAATGKSAEGEQRAREAANSNERIGARGSHAA